MDFKKKGVCQFEYRYGDDTGYICMHTVGLIQPKPCNPDICPIHSIAKSLNSIARRIM